MIANAGALCHDHAMNQADLLKLSNHEIEARAIEAVIAYERAAGRMAVDPRSKKGALVDVESFDDTTGEKRLIEIKAFGGAGRGDFLWLEPNQVKAFEEDPAAHLYLVTNVRSADPSAIRILDLTGEQLRESSRRSARSTTSRSADARRRSRRPRRERISTARPGRRRLLLQILDGVLALHDRGYHRTRFAADMRPTGSTSACTSAGSRRCRATRSR